MDLLRAYFPASLAVITKDKGGLDLMKVGMATPEKLEAEISVAVCHRWLSTLRNYSKTIKHTPEL